MGIIKKCGFTLIETIIVIGVVALVLPALFSIVFVVLQQQARIIRLNEVKQEGDAILTKFESGVKSNAVSIHMNSIPPGGRVCDKLGNDAGPYNNVQFGDKVSGQWFGFYLDGTEQKVHYMVKDDPVSDPRDIPMTTDKVDVSNFEVSCSMPADFSQPVVVLSFDICYRNVNNSGIPCDSIRSEEVASIHYSTTVRLRNQ